MKKTAYEMHLLSSLIVSPRSGHALYRGIDEFIKAPVADTPLLEGKNEVKVVYPFYQYGEYKKYDPEHAEYYLPGSSVKGALQLQKSSVKRLMADDVKVSNKDIVLRNLWKAQYLTDETEAKFETFFENVGNEMIKEGTNLQGVLYLEDDAEFTDILELANRDTKYKMKQMCAYIQSLLSAKYNMDLLQKLDEIESELSCYLNDRDIILLGGYKGLLHSILLDNNMRNLSGGLFIDFKTMLPHGLVKIRMYDTQ